MKAFVILYSVTTFLEISFILYMMTDNPTKTNQGKLYKKGWHQGYYNARRYTQYDSNLFKIDSLEFELQIKN